MDDPDGNENLSPLAILAAYLLLGIVGLALWVMLSTGHQMAY